MIDEQGAEIGGTSEEPGPKEPFKVTSHQDGSQTDPIVITSDEAVQVDDIQAELARMATRQLAAGKQEERRGQLEDEAEREAQARVNQETLHDSLNGLTERFANGLRYKARDLPPDDRKDHRDGSTTGEWKHTDTETGTEYRSEVRFKQADNGDVTLLSYQLAVGKEWGKGLDKFFSNDGRVKIDFVDNNMSEIELKFDNSSSEDFSPTLPRGALRSHITEFAPLYMHPSTFWGKDKPADYNALTINLDRDNPDISFGYSGSLGRIKKHIYSFNPDPDVNTFMPEEGKELPKGSPASIPRDRVLHLTESMLNVIPHE